MIAHKKSGLHGYGLYLLSGAYFVLQFLCSNKKFLSLCVFLSPYFLLTFFLRPLPAPYLFAWSVRSLMQRVLYYAGALPYAFCWQRSYMPAAKRFFSFGTRRQCACRLKTVYDMHASPIASLSCFVALCPKDYYTICGKSGFVRTQR